MAIKRRYAQCRKVGCTNYPFPPLLHSQVPLQGDCNVSSPPLNTKWAAENMHKSRWFSLDLLDLIIVCGLVDISCVPHTQEPQSSFMSILQQKLTKKLIELKTETSTSSEFLSLQVVDNLHKVNRCPARYSPRHNYQPTHQQGTK